MTSRQTTEARAAAREAARRWGEHKRHCPACSAAANARQFDKVCDPGRKLRQEHRDADRALRRERELDRQPLPGQEKLFP